MAPLWHVGRAASVPLVLAALVFAIGWPSLGASFQFDDWNVIVGDPRVQSLAAWWQSMPGMRALLKASFALNYELGGRVEVFRAFNLFVHALNAALVFALLQRLGRATSQPQPAAAAALAALIFALHPVQTEAVTYLSGRSVSLAATFSLLATLLWQRRTKSLHPARWVAASTLMFALALACKEIAVILPAALLLLHAVTQESRGARKNMPTLTPWRDVMPHLALVAAATVLAVTVLPYAWLLRATLEHRSIGANLLTQANGVSYLIGQLMFFDRLNADPMLPTVAGLNAAALGRGSLLLALLACGLTQLRRRPALAFGVLWFFVWLAPTNSLIPREDVANDRQLYLALAGPAWLLSLGLIRIIRTLPPSARPLVIALFAVSIATLLGSATRERNRVYDNEIGFWRDVIAKTPRNVRALNNLGMAYAVACRRDEALATFAVAERLAPGDYRARVNAWRLRERDLPGVPATCAAPVAETKAQTAENPR